MGKRNKSESNFLVQGSILAVASIISRIIGLLYRVPLTAIIGNKGNNYYSCAFEIYSMMLLISSYSLPLAVSKLVSARVAKGERKNAYRVFHGALIFAFVTGTVSGLIIYFGAGTFTRLMKTPLSIYALKVLAPTLFIVAVLGVFRGFYQGLGTMMPSAVSQIIEQVVNAIMSVWAAYMLYSYGAKIGGVLGNAEQYSSAYGAAGGTIGTGAGSLAAFLFALFIFAAFRPVYKRQMRRDRDLNQESYSYIFKILIMTIVPVLLSTAIYNVSSIIDQGIYKNIAIATGTASDSIDEWWGIFSGKYKVLINVPISIASAMAASCVPSLTAAFANKDRELVNNKINSSIRFIMVIAFPCAVGMGVLASPILQLLFGDATAMPERMIQLGAVSIILYSLSTLSNAILQGINRMRIPVRNAVIALVLHIIFLVALLYLTNTGVYAVVLANTFFALVMCVMNGLAIRKYAGYTQEIKRTFLLPALAALVMGIAVFASYQGIHILLKSNAIATILSICVGAVVYAVVLLLTKGLTEEEILNFPKGRLLVRVATKMHLLR